MGVGVETSITKGKGNAIFQVKKMVKWQKMGKKRCELAVGSISG